MAVSNFNSATRPEPYGGIGKGFPRMYSARLIAKLGNNKGLIDIEAPLPENYQFELSTSFDNPFNQPLTNLASQFNAKVGGAVDKFATGRQMVTGNSTIAKWMSGANWTGGSLFSIQVPFVIQAYTSTGDEVVKIMRDLLKLVAPSEDKVGMLVAPGPTMVQGLDSNFKGDDITIEIGSFFRMRPCVIDNVTCEFDTQMDVNEEMPLSATITVSAKSFWATTKEDLDSMFYKVKGK